ncbi:hypothetical protein C0992_011629, partial [Termitomyces sp. T32_za158]
SDIDTEDRVQMRFMEKNKKLLVQQSSNAFIIDLGAGPKKFGKYAHIPISAGKMSTELVVAPTTVKAGYRAKNVAFVDFFNVYFVPGSVLRGGDEVWSKPGNATKGLTRVSLDGGHDVTFTRDGKKIFWFLGPYLHSLEISELQKCSSAIDQDPVNFGISCVKDQIKYQEIVVEHPTDIARLKRDAEGRDQVVIYNATLLTMETGQEQYDVIRGGQIIIRGGVITAVGLPGQDEDIPHASATAINAHGGDCRHNILEVGMY